MSEIKVNITDEFCHVWSYSTVGVKNQSYLYKIVIDSECAFVMNVECQCVAGLGGKCGHIAAILFALELRNSAIINLAT